MTQLLSQGFFCWPSRIQSSMKRLVIHADSTRPVLDAQGLVVEGKPPRHRPISRLICRARPLAIVRLVSHGVIQSFYCHAWWPASHVGKEQIEGLPPFTDGDADRSVVPVAISARIGAPVFHRSPDVVFRSAMKSSSVTMRGHSGGADLAPETPTTASRSVGQAATNDQRAITTRAETIPNDRYAAIRGRTSANRKSSEYEIGQIPHRWHATIILDQMEMVA